MTDPTSPGGGADDQAPQAGQPGATPYHGSSSSAADSWHDFGVPHSGPAEPVTYRPAMFERTRPEPESPATHEGEASQGEQTPQAAAPVEPSAPAEPTAEIPSPWAWPSTPSPDSTTPGQPAPFYPRQPPDGAPYQQQPPDGPPYQEQPPYQPFQPQPVYQPIPAYPAPLQGTLPPGSPPTDAPARPRRGRRVAGLVALALVCAVLGGAVALAGARVLDRANTSLGSALPAPGPGSTARPDGSIAKIAADALPSVVTIQIKTSQGNGTGSGFVIDKQGHILTNNHVASAGAGPGSIQVELNNGTKLPATVVGADSSYDLAVLKVNTTDLTPLQFGRSADVVVGDGVIAVGAPLGLDASVTSGIVSALNRPVSASDGSDQSFINAIQTDAAINPGNSGGPLLDLNGKVIGVNSAIARVPGTSDTTGGNIGVGFAIPSDQAVKTAQQLIATGKAEHPALGVRVDRSYDGDGARIAAGGVTAGSAAAQAGLHEGDIVVQFQGRNVTDADALIVAIRSLDVGDTVQLKVKRGDQTIDISMTLQSG